MDQEFRQSSQGEAAPARARDAPFTLALAAYNLVRLPNLLVVQPLAGQMAFVETPDHDMAGAGSYILFASEGGEFALDCLTGAI